MTPRKAKSGVAPIMRLTPASRGGSVEKSQRPLSGAKMRNRIPKVTAIFLLFASARIDAQGPTTRSLDSLLSTRIQSASRYLQTSAEAAASVTIVTEDDIRTHRYRTLLEVLESVRGFYVSNDRNYPALGIRGFSRPSDYNDRILLMIDGHALNDQTWGGAPVGSDLPINLDAVERIEVIRGPGSALYGTNAMFAVINIVTKTGAQLNGVRAHVSGGTGAVREGAVAAGTTFGESGSLSGSAIFSRSDGATLRYPELADDNGGISRNQDWEESAGGYVSASAGPLGGRVGYRTRSKGIPTGAFGVPLGDTRARTRDRTLWGEVSASREVSSALQLRARVYGDWYDYSGVYPEGPGAALSDGGGSTAFGGEATGIWDPISRDRITFGAEYRRATRANYFERPPSGMNTEDDAPFSLASVFAENALHFHSSADLITGVRYEQRSRRPDAVAPRVALIVTPDRKTTLKLLYGQAYRTPSVAEADLATSFYSRNPNLRAERIETTEIEAQRHILEPLLFTAGVFQYRVRNLIDQFSLPDGGAQFVNQARARARGAEIQADYVPDQPFAVHASYVAQQTRDDEDERLTNSPAHIAQIAGSIGSASHVQATLNGRYESGRRTFAGPSTDAFFRMDFNVSWTLMSASVSSWARALAISARVTNLFDANYAVSGGPEHVQAAIPQPGRVVTVRLDWSR